MVNPADLMTENMAGVRIVDLMRRLGQAQASGRAQVALDVQGAGGKKEDTAVGQKVKGQAGGGTEADTAGGRR